MNQAKRASLAIASLVIFALAGCKPPPDSTYFNRGTPESLLDVSSEVVNLSVADPQELAQLSKWIEEDKPTRAELYCSEGDIRCNEARRVLDRHNIPTMNVPSPDYSVALVYERILARDCNQRFREDLTNNHNANHPAFGCSIAANIVQHVSDKQQFVNPSLMDVPPAQGAVQAYQRAYTTQRQAPQPYQIDQSRTNSARSN